MTAEEPTIDDLLAELNAGRTVTGGSPLHGVMHRAAQQALRITAELNGSYHEEAEVRALLSRLTGAPIDDSVTLFPPFHTDFGRTRGSAATSSSTWASSSRIRAASPSPTVR